MSEYVYFLRNPQTGLTKIGKSIEPHKRKNSLEAEYGVELEVVAVGKTSDCTKLEKETHAHFDSLRVSGEWFRLDSPFKAAREVLADTLLDWSEAIRIKPKRVAENPESLSKIYVWTFAEYLKKNGLTAYQVAMKVPRGKENTVYRVSRENPSSVSFEIMGMLRDAVAELTNNSNVSVMDFMEYQE